MVRGGGSDRSREKPAARADARETKNATQSRPARAEPRATFGLCYTRHRFALASRRLPDVPCSSGSLATSVDRRICRVSLFSHDQYHYSNFPGGSIVFNRNRAALVEI